MEASVVVLNRILFREESALLPYLSNAGAWTNVAESPAAATLKRLIDEHEAACGRLADLVTQRKGIPAGARFPAEFSSIHFTALDHLFPWLVAYQKWLLETMEADLATLRDEEARTLVKSILDVKRRHLTELEGLAATYAGPKAVSTRY